MSSVYCLFTPSSLYPHPEARLIDARGEVIHSWSCDEEQPPREDDPPSFLRGWNHVELDHEGNLFALVPLQAVLKLDARSNLVWKCLIAAHHDIAILPGGRLYTLCEEPALVRVDGRESLILDHHIAILDAEGAVEHYLSLYELLSSDAEMRELLHDEVRRRYELSSPAVRWALQSEVQRGFGELDASVSAENARRMTRRRTLQRLRELPGSPCDVLHPNTLEVVDAHPRRLWQKGNVLVALRSLDLVVVVDLRAGRVVWRWGRGEISGPHQPSALPNGNVLLFDNGVAVARSRLVEVNPVTGHIEWEYVASPPESFFCEVAGGCEQLPNGDVLVTDSQAARMFRLTRDKKIVWELVVSDVPTPTNPHNTTFYRAAGVDARVVAKLLGRARATI